MSIAGRLIRCDGYVRLTYLNSVYYGLGFSVQFEA